MLKRLSQGEATVNDLAAPFKMSLPAASKHIKVLEKAGLLTKTIQKQQRPCKLNGTKLKQAVAWIEQYKSLWEGRLNRMEDVAKSLQTTEAVIATAAKSNQDKVTVATIIATNSAADKPIKKLAIAQVELINPEAAVSSPSQTKTSKQPKRKDNDDNQTQPQIGFDF